MRHFSKLRAYTRLELLTILSTEEKWHYERVPEGKRKGRKKSTEHNNEPCFTVLDQTYFLIILTTPLPASVVTRAMYTPE